MVHYTLLLFIPFVNQVTNNIIINNSIMESINHKSNNDNNKNNKKRITKTDTEETQSFLITTYNLQSLTRV